MQLLGLLFVVLLLGTFDERNHITHAEDTASHTFGIEHVECLHLLARTDELDWLLHHGADREGRTTTRITIELGKDYASEVETIVKFLGSVNSILTCHRIDDEEDLVWINGILDVLDLTHHLLINCQTTSGIDDDHIIAVVLGLCDGILGYLDGIL